MVKNKIDKVKKYIINNKLLTSILFIILISLVYCSLNTFVSSDDLVYSFYYRTSTRVTNILQVIKNQVSDYITLSPRIFIHSIVQFLLIFGKKLWSILNPIVILLNFYLIYKIVNLYIKNNNKIFNYVFGFICFLLMINYKWLIYWIAGSVNYVWLSLILLLFIYLYLKKGLSKNYIINSVLLLIISILHESSFIFSFIFIIFSLLYDFIINKKFNKKNLLLFIPLIISGVFLFLGPSTLGRISNNEWNNYSFIKKILIAFPTISKNLYNLTNINNIVPSIFVIIILLKLFYQKNKFKYIAISFTLIFTLLCFIFNIECAYLVLAIIILFDIFYINFIDKRNELSIIFLSYYAVCYSMCLTIEYLYGRPNYFMYIFIILLCILYINDVFSDKILSKLNIILIPVLLILLSSDVIIYTKIGNLYRDRINSIKNYDNSGIIYLKKMDEKYSLYHMDLNQPSDDNYYTYRYFLNYYNIPKDAKIEFIK